MGQEQEFKKVKLFSGFIYHSTDIFEEVKQELEAQFSPVDSRSPQIIFDKTDYYNKEMGTPLYKQFISFQQLIDPQQLPDIKILTNRIEDRYANEGNRIINIDPGFLSDANVILATTKNHYHRVPLTKSIYAHIEYVIKKRNTLTPLEWTYPDFRTAQYMEFFQQLILIYKQDIKKESKRKTQENNDS